MANSVESLLMQLRKGLHFICEQPSGSDLYYEHQWPAVLNHPDVYQQRYGRCMAGLKAQYGPHKGAFIKKASTMTASKKMLLERFEDFQCRGNHAHLQMHGEGQNLSACQVWTWDEANRVAYGIRRFKKVQLAYPSANIQASLGQEEERPPRGRDSAAPPVNEPKCIGCQHRRARTDPEHVVASSANAVILMVSLLSGNALAVDCARIKVTMLTCTHVPGECRMTIAQDRKSAPRRGHEPRDPRRQATDDVTTNLTPADLPDPPLTGGASFSGGALPLSGGQSSSRGPDTYSTYNEFAALIKMNKSDLQIPEMGCPLT